MLDLTLDEIANMQKDYDGEIFEYLLNSNTPIVIHGVRETAKFVAEALIRNGIDNFCFVSDLASTIKEIEIKGRIYNVIPMVEVCNIDNFLQTVDEKVGLIKMDIEGFELGALKGAEQTIKRFKPKLAICAYHKANDLITIPQFLRKIVPEYKFYFRLHAPVAVEAVLYAV